MSDKAETGAVEIPDPPNLAQEPTIDGLPGGYIYRVTRYADIILRDAFPFHFDILIRILSEFRVDLLQDIVKPGGSKAAHVRRLEDILKSQGWRKRNITVSRYIDGRLLHSTKGHEIDHFAVGNAGSIKDAEEYPGIAIEIEWNNKDPFYDRDLLNFQALHREGAIGVGIIITRGPRLQKLMSKHVSTNENKPEKYGASTTHWDKLMPRINLGGGGECPLLLIGIEPELVENIDKLERAFATGQVLRPSNYDKI